MSSDVQPRRSGRVFLAEDDDELRELLALAMVSAGFDVVAVATGDELLDCLDGTTGDGRPDVVVTDLRMPGRDGLSVLSEVRRQSPATPVLLITAFGEAAVHRRAHELGAARVLDKPVGLADLLDALQQLTAS